jgi:hypothetical protein
MPIHHNATQCLHQKVDGTRCGSPALTDKQFCYWHNRIRRQFKEKEIELPPLEDVNAVQVAINDLLHAMLQETIDQKKATSLLYGLQLARDNMRHLTAVAATKAPSGELSDCHIAYLRLLHGIRRIYTDSGRILPWSPEDEALIEKAERVLFAPLFVPFDSRKPVPGAS